MQLLLHDKNFSKYAKGLRLDSLDTTRLKEKRQVWRHQETVSHAVACYSLDDVNPIMTGYENLHFLLIFLLCSRINFCV